MAHKSYKFKGKDPIELSECFGLIIPKHLDLEEDMTLNILKKYLVLNANNKNIVKQCRQYLTAFIKHTYESEDIIGLFISLSNIKDDFNFMCYFIRLLDTMWI